MRVVKMSYAEYLEHCLHQALGENCMCDAGKAMTCPECKQDIHVGGQTDLVQCPSCIKVFKINEPNKLTLWGSQ